MVIIVTIVYRSVYVFQWLDPLQGSTRWGLMCVFAVPDHQIQGLLLEAGAFCDQATEDDASTPLIFAAEWCHLDVARVLLEAAAAPDAATEDNGWTPLHYACETWFC